jgi:ComF family protein
MNPSVEYFLELFFPRLCLICEEKLLRQERFICLKCMLHLPRTDFRLPGETSMEQLFYGRIPVEKAFAYFEFRKGSDYRKILHQLKYKGQKEIGEYFGEHFAAELMRTGSFSQFDYLCPVPLHPKKERKRGFNQSYHIALGMSRQLRIPVLKDNIRRIADTGTQTRRSRYERWENVENMFEVIRPEVFDGKHIVLVDDVVTTGATLEACATAILSCCDAKISILAMAMA